jgi:RNA polymerase sigma-70 factor, ECF subfamily
MRAATDRLSDPAPAARPPPSTPSPAALPDGPVANFTALVRAEIDFVWRQLRRLGLSRADADDATQEVFLVASRRREQLVPGKERSFLYGTAVRVAANVRRSLQRRREVPDERRSEPPLDAPLPDEVLERRRARALLDELLEQLPAELSRALVLAEVEQLTVAAIAELEGIPAGTAASRLRRARSVFRELLEHHPANGEGGER